jgi:hypothetical protein
MAHGRSRIDEKENANVLWSGHFLGTISTHASAFVFRSSSEMQIQERIVSNHPKWLPYSFSVIADRHHLPTMISFWYYLASICSFFYSFFGA